MHTFSFITALVASATLSAGSPTPAGSVTGAVKAFSVGQVPVHGNSVRSGAKAYLKALNKYHAYVPTTVREAAVAAAAVSGVVPASPEANDQEYLCPVTIGTPGVTVNLDFDTGSADLWVFASEQPSAQRSGHSIYTPGSSSTSQLKSGYAWNIMYGDGSGASGNVFGDKVVIGGVTATSQAIEAATSVSTQFVQDTDNDGLVGLAFDNINTVTPTKQPTFFDTVKLQLSQPLFAAYLRHNAAGVYDFGFTDSTKYSGTIGYTTVNSDNGFWEFTAGTYYVGSTSHGSLGDSIADTGTSLILVPDAVVATYYKSVSGSQNNANVGGYIFPCSSTLPTFSIIIGGAKRTVPGTYMNYASVGSNYCYGGIQSNSGLQFSILGDVFLKSQYVVFSAPSGATPQIGFATQK